LGDSNSTSVALTDIDNDGDIDAAVGRVGSDDGVLLWINDGGGVFSAGQKIGNQDVQAVSFADLDGDGDPDMVQGHNGTNVGDPDKPEITTWQQTGPGVYVPFLPDSTFGVGSNFIIVAIELGDLDGDGDLDVFSASGMAPRVWMNQGGALSDVQTLDTGLGTRSSDIALVDFDLDGDLDAVVANECNSDDIGTDACSNHVWLNQGGKQGGEEGVFLDSGQRLGTSKTRSVAVGSAAGQINVFFGNAAKSNEIWSVDQEGVFRDTGQVIGANLTTSDIAAVDIDGDGDNELIAFNPFFGNDTYGSGGGSSDIGTCVECLNDSHCGEGETCLFEQCRNNLNLAKAPTAPLGQQGSGYGDSNPTVFYLDDQLPGAQTAHRITIDIAEGDFQIYSFVINYPFDFHWNGFNALGPARTKVGSQELDTDFDGNAEFEIALLSYDGSTAYGDFDGSLSPIGNSLIGYKRLSSHRLSSFWPYGGDFDPSVSRSSAPYRAKLVINSGVMTNPTTEGDYEVRFRAVSVDPDTGGADDGQGEPPLELDRTFILSISRSIFKDGFEGVDTR